MFLYLSLTHQNRFVHSNLLYCISLARGLGWVVRQNQSSIYSIALNNFYWNVEILFEEVDGKF